MVGRGDTISGIVWERDLADAESGRVGGWPPLSRRMSSVEAQSAR